jgi:hypothetical protein
MAIKINSLTLLVCVFVKAIAGSISYYWQQRQRQHQGLQPRKAGRSKAAGSKTRTRRTAA